MSNPAPTLNQINAFNATQGTTIDFNIIGGTELVRSNKIYIYDLSDNSLICTHLYVSTESTHELPANTDGSIVYESGKSSADFVNGAQYYAQIQTFTDIAGTEGGSGLSVAKMFWCLVNPTLTITTIPSTISTTSYNISATYNANTSVVSNIIQQYQFNLYSATGSLLQSSGVIVGNGEQQGTSTAYDISYNFTGLNVGSSYYVTVDVTTTQGMNVNAQSSTFIVSIDTPTLGEATVVNNACDGYISVTSNLSSEYGGSGSGEIASFVTNSINNVSSLKVSLEPIQDLHGYDKPWVGGARKNLANIDAVTDGTLTGESVAVSGSENYQAAHIVVSLNGGTTYTFSAKATRVDAIARISFRNLTGGQNLAQSAQITSAGNLSVSYTPPSDASVRLAMFSTFGTANPSATTVYEDIQLEIGSSPTTYEPYKNICPISGRNSADVNVAGKNLLEIKANRTSYTSNGVTWALNNDGSISAVGTPTGTSQCVLNSAGYIKLAATPKLKAGTYRVSKGVGPAIRGRVGLGANSTYLQVFTNEYVDITIADGEIINLSIYAEATDASNVTAYLSVTRISDADGYEPYEGETYTAAFQEAVYGGTVELVSGVLSVGMAFQEFDGDENWAIQETRSNGIVFKQYVNEITFGYNNDGYMVFNEAEYAGSFVDNGAILGRGALSSDNRALFIFVPTSLGIASTVDEWKAWLADNPLQVCYKLATPQTYQLSPQTISTLAGVNNVWSEQGGVEVAYNIPITNLLVKRQDIADVSGTWLTLHSQPITQASDMDFTYIDFLNQYGKTYRYALVPLLTQTQSGVEVEVEGGYTVSDEVQSVFDGVFIVDSTGSQKCKANVGYGNVDMNQTVGTITPIGSKYPVVITNSKNQYHNGSISGTIVPDDYYFNGNLSRIDMVNKRDELEQFLTNKRAKIIKDWNGKIWLVMIMDNVSCTFNNNYGMGIVNFSTNWVEVGDPTNQQDLQATGLINIGGA